LAAGFFAAVLFFAAGFFAAGFFAAVVFFAAGFFAAGFFAAVFRVVAIVSSFLVCPGSCLQGVVNWVPTNGSRYIQRVRFDGEEKCIVLRRRYPVITTSSKAI
jgi:hypothetical protein